MGRGVLFGLAVALVGGAIWGVVAAASGYIFVLAGIAIGVAVAWAVRMGAEGINGAVIAAAVVLTLLAVFVGEIVALSIVAAPFGASPVDVLVAYPQIVAAFPLDTALAYGFGLIGAAAGGWYLSRERKKTAMRYGRPSPLGFVSPAPDGTDAAPRYRILKQGPYDVELEVAIPSPSPHVVRASYTTMTARAEVHLDGVRIARPRVWGMKKEVPVPLTDGGGHLIVRFAGALAPRIEVFLNGALIARA